MKIDIHLIDDDEEFARELANKLTKYDIHTIRSSNAEEVITMLENKKYDLLVADYDLSESSESQRSDFDYGSLLSTILAMKMLNDVFQWENK